MENNGSASYSNGEMSPLTPMTAGSVQSATGEESQDSIFARNRAIYEASQQNGNSATSSQTQAGSPAPPAGTGFTFDQRQKQARPRSSSPQQTLDINGASHADASGSEGPARKKLVRAGDVAARNGSTDPQYRPSSAASQAPSVSPYPGQQPQQFAQSGMQQPQSQDEQRNELERNIEINAHAFMQKNPGYNIQHVKAALRHARGVFDENFKTAMHLQMQALQQQHQVAGTTPPIPSQAQFSPPQTQAMGLPPQNPQMQMQPGQQHMLPPQAQYAPQQQPQQMAAPMQMPRYPGQQVSPVPPQPAQNPYDPYQQAGGQAGQVQSQTPQPQGQRLSPGTAAGVHPHQQPFPGGVPIQNGSHARPSPSPQPQIVPPIVVYPGTHPAIGFSAIQVLPKASHAQFLSLSPQQQVDYSLDVFKSLNETQRQHYSAEGQIRKQMIAQQMRTGPPARGPGNPNYIGYANQLPTQQQQQQQQRFPGQQPVFRIGANQGGAAGNQTELLKQVQHLTPEQQAQWLQQQRAIQARQAQMYAASHASAQYQNQARLQQQAQAKAYAQDKGSSKPKKKKRSRNYDSDEDDEDLRLDDTSDEDRDDDDDDVGVESEGEQEREAKGLEWFNTCTKEELIEMTAAKPEIADAVFEMRPYTSPGDIRTKLRKRKGVSGQLYDNYVDLMLSYSQTDECLEACTGIGKELLEIMSIWTGGKKIMPTVSNAPTPGPTGLSDDTSIVGQAMAEEEKSGDTLAVPSASATGTSTPISAETTAVVGTDLATLSEDALLKSNDEDAAPEIKAAFDGYLHEQPKTLKEGIKLKSYQMLGVNWINLLYKKKISCILADEMGLGKTAQVIAFFAHLKEAGKPGPHLVIVPSSTLDNWCREFENFAPDIKVFAYYGSQAERGDLRVFLKEQEELDVIVTTYNMATGAADDRKFLKKMDFKACIFDEGHQLKNSESKKYKDLMDIKVQWRCLLTGTPLQNNLQELVSLLSFILPKIFSDAQESLRAIFKVPPEAQKNLLTRQRVRAAKSVMTPFVLRRKKAQVLQDLPPKTEIIEYCEMTPAQKEIYRETLAKHKKAVAESKEEPVEEEAPKPKKRGRASAKTGKQVQENTSSNVLMALRKAANHPMLFRRIYTDKKIKQLAKDCLKEEEFHDRNVDYIYEDLDLMTDFEIHRFVEPYKILNKYALTKDEWMDAGKVHKLKQMLPEIKARGDRVLIFSQFVQVLNIIQQVLQTMDMRYLMLTGQTHVNDRQGLVDEFTEDEGIDCFLLSTRAGGLGLNLMAANVVIILDMDFNPHNDKQAGDRAYRLGQKKPVTVYKFVTKGSIEEDLLALAETKLALDEQVSGESAISADMGGADDIELDETETLVEKKVKANLMQTLQKRFDEGTDDIDSSAKVEELAEDGKPTITVDAAPDAKEEGEESQDAKPSESNGKDGSMSTDDGETKDALKNAEAVDAGTTNGTEVKEEDESMKTEGADAKEE